MEKHKIDLQSEAPNLETAEIPTNCTLATYTFINFMILDRALSLSSHSTQLSVQ